MISDFQFYRHLNNNNLNITGILHVSYAPEYETVADVREKIIARKRDVRYSLNKLKVSTNASFKRHTGHKNDSALWIINNENQKNSLKLDSRLNDRLLIIILKIKKWQNNKKRTGNCDARFFNLTGSTYMRTYEKIIIQKQ